MDNAHAIHNFDQRYVIELATKTRQIRDAQAFRYQVFCRERGILRGDAAHSMESDEHDAYARHVILRELTGGRNHRHGALGACALSSGAQQNLCPAASM
jgi:putative hemolysin